MGEIMRPISEPKTSRRSASKVKSGCLTWVRRIKCDESKPACLKCTSTGRACDGYDLEKRFRNFEPKKVSKAPAGGTLEVQQKSTSPVVSIEGHVRTRAENLSLAARPLSPLKFSGSPLEQRFLDFFLQRTAPALGGFFDVEFWSHLLPRAAAAEKPIQHALIAIAALHEESLRFNESSFSSQSEVSLTQYNKAIRSLHQRVSLEGQNLQVILLTCILFVCLEFLRGEPEIGLEHLQSGLKILISHRASRHVFMNISGFTLNPEELDEVDAGIEHAFSRLSIQASLVGGTLPQGFRHKIYVKPTQSSGCESFSSIKEARDRLNDLIIQSLRQYDVLSPMTSTFVDHAQEIIDRYKLVASLNQWTTRLDLLVAHKTNNPGSQDVDAMRLLRIQSIVAIIWNSTTLSNKESEFDRYKTQFITIVSLASEIVDKAASSTSTLPGSRALTSASSTSRSTDASSLREPTLSPFLFALEMGILFPLYFTAIKCRCPIIRRKASSLLSRLEPQQQGIWHAGILGKISQYIIQFEEAGSLVDVPCDTQTWPTEEQRIHSAYNTTNHDLRKRVQEVVFVSRPDGPGGEWVYWSERLHY